MKIRTSYFLLFISCCCYGQDSSKVLRQEIGLNVVSFVKQFINNSAAATVTQLPYDFFYNAYWKDRIGIRFGAGIRISNTETKIDGQVEPKTTDKLQYNIRTGLSYNFLAYKKLTLNVFADYVFAQNKNETATTVTAQVFPDPISTVTTKTSDVTRSQGTQAGVGIKFNLHKYFCLYAEAPLTFLVEKTTSEVNINDTGTTDFSKSTVTNTSLQFYVPTTLYVILRF